MVWIKHTDGLVLTTRGKDTANCISLDGIKVTADAFYICLGTACLVLDRVADALLRAGRKVVDALGGDEASKEGSDEEELHCDKNVKL